MTGSARCQRSRRDPVVWLWLYLVAYVSLVAGALVALWRAGALAHVPAVWTVLVLMAALGLGALVAVAFLRIPQRS
jgi:hypothetical protein